jgi:hypothetical protein
MTWTVPRTWSPGELVTATQLNTHLRDNLNSLRSESFLTQRFRGLTLRSHPDADKKFNHRVWFIADEVIMDDSTRLAITTPQAPSLAVSGAGGHRYRREDDQHLVRGLRHRQGRRHAVVACSTRARSGRSTRSS